MKRAVFHKLSRQHILGVKRFFIRFEVEMDVRVTQLRTRNQSRILDFELAKQNIKLFEIDFSLAVRYLPEFLDEQIFGDYGIEHVHESSHHDELVHGEMRCLPANPIK